MADRLATPEDLAALLERDDLDAYKAGLLIECATAVVQAIVGQRIVAGTSTAVLPAPAGHWLDLPQWPVRSVDAVLVDGVADTEWRLRGGRLWRARGWIAASVDPGEATITWEHGYQPGDQGLQLARSAVLSLCAGAFGNPRGVVREQIDDYAVQYEAMSARLQASPFLVDALRSQYGLPAFSVRMTAGG